MDGRHLGDEGGAGPGGGVPGGGGHGGGGQECGTLCHPEGAPCPPPPCCGQSPATGLEQRQEAGMTLQLGFPSCLKRVLQNAHPTF